MPLGDRDIGFEPLDVDVVALDVALQRLSSTYPRQSQLVELRFFGGLTVDEIAAVLDVAPITVKTGLGAGQGMALSRAAGADGLKA